MDWPVPYSSYWNEQSMGGVRNAGALANILANMGINLADYHAGGGLPDQNLMISRLQGLSQAQNPDLMRTILAAINPRTLRSY